MSRLCLASSFLTVLIPLASAQANQEVPLDVLIQIIDDAVVTASSVGDDPVVLVDRVHRVWGSTHGSEDPQFPFTSTEPGFHALPGDDTAGAVFSFSIPDALKVWTGSGFAATDTTLLIQFGPASAVTGDGPAPGFAFAADASGLLHVHFARTLVGPGGSDPAPGIYLLPLELLGVNPPLKPTPTFWFLSNLGLDEAELAEAMQWTDLYLACSVDRNGDGIVNGFDLATLLGGWGSADQDLDGDDDTDGFDLALLLGAWGYRCP